MKLILGYVNLAVIHKVQDGGEVGIVHALQVDERLVVGVVGQDPPEEGRAGGQHHLVGLQLGRALIAAESHVEELAILAQFLERGRDVRLKVVPPGKNIFIINDFFL